MAEPLAFLEMDDRQAWPPQGQWTYEDYLRLPEDGRRYEVIRGHLYVTAAPSFDHQFAVTQLGRRFGNFVSDHDLGVVLVAPFDIRLPREIASPVQPDLVFFKTGNEPRSGDKSFEGVPDLVVEVLSPGTQHLDKRVKLAAYRDAGVAETWLVDPQLRTLLVYGLTDRIYVELDRSGVSGSVKSRLLAGLRVATDDIFPRQR